MAEQVSKSARRVVEILVEEVERWRGGASSGETDDGFGLSDMDDEGAA